ncbi:biotin transporter BioY [Senegalia massiliensis]|uniref:Biotin transporter n=1 Tax=Senegalia massiliensis TaxID=1720316 RepID=A0A845QUI9_9CLOT|nr:biotin transporter BioY [Senegalia massiliensis]NBI05694.1 biotin transporter BioY [Senegalia massiliensis]
MKTRDITLISLFVALTAVCAQISIPLPSGVPITLQILAVFLSGAILGSKYGFLSQIVYLLLGTVGIPLFSLGTGGLQILLGLTGGYIWSFPIASFIIGLIIEKSSHTSNQQKIFQYGISFLIGLVIIYLFGSVQFYILSNMTYIDTIKVTILPFIIPDLIKIAISVPLVIKIKSSLLKSNLLYI